MISNEPLCILFLWEKRNLRAPPMTGVMKNDDPVGVLDGGQPVSDFLRKR
jgi:hypothetical protein